METKAALAALAALAHETRLGVFRLLVRHGGRGIAAGDIAEALELAPPTLSFHLKELRSAGVVASEREGRSIRYRPDFAAMSALVTFLSENCCEDADRAPRSPRRARRGARPDPNEGEAK